MKFILWFIQKNETSTIFDDFLNEYNSFFDILNDFLN